VALTLEELVRAGTLLFGAGFRPDVPGWRADLRAAYRRRALETHPDRARALGRAEAELAREFQAVKRAYELLAAAAPGSRATRGPAPAARAAEPRPARPARPERRGARAEPLRPEPRRPGAPRVRVGVRPEDLPQRRLRLAEFLYYTGRVSWSDLVEAIAWQRVERPPLGRIAVALGFLARSDVDALLARRRAEGAGHVPFGAYAVRAGYLTSFQRLAALGRQAALHRPIGRYFVERGLVDDEDLEEIRVRIARHNSRF
jgi:hypothetical protein